PRVGRRSVASSPVPTRCVAGPAGGDSRLVVCGGAAGGAGSTASVGTLPRRFRSDMPYSLPLPEDIGTAARLPMTQRGPEPADQPGSALRRLCHDRLLGRVLRD